MALDGQRVDPNRYSVIPRTLTFPLCEGRLLLAKLGPEAGGWSGQYNGLGGHLEVGEDPLSAAVRELREESGITLPDQRLCAVVTVDTGESPGIGLYVFVGKLEAIPGELSDPMLEWVPLERVNDLPLVEDLPTLLPAVIDAYERRTVVSAAYRYSPTGELQISIA